jgi:hypothetical protein
MDSENLVIWNVRGLNGRARRSVVAELVRQECCSVRSRSVGDQTFCYL